MAEDPRPLFSFVSSGMESDTFHVVRFQGQEALSSLYRFEILLVSKDDAIDFDTVLSSTATFVIKATHGTQESPYHGVLESFEQMQRVGEYALYRAVLVPGLWRLTQTMHNQIFLKKTPSDIIRLCLQDGGLLSSDFETRIHKDGRKWEYVCQYNESHFNFLSHWTERYGFYYYFDQSGATEKLIVTDTRMAHESLRAQPTLEYADISGLDALEREHIVKEFSLRSKPLPKRVKLKSYNYEKPELDLQVEAEVSSSGVGDVYTYGEDFLTMDEGHGFARVRAEELLCHHRLYEGISNIPFVTPGYTFTLQRHFRTDFNRDYLITAVDHSGGQEAYLSSGLGIHLPQNDDRPSYRNHFVCIPANVQYRPRRESVKPKIAGTVHAKIDAAGSGDYAELDNQGRYKVIMPFDVSGKNGGKASTWLRKAEPYSGSNHGMHFPLHKGTEVMVAFIDGDPNRPFIQSSVANPSTPSVVNDTTQTQNRIQTGGDNKLSFEDQNGQQGIHMSTPMYGTSFHMGYISDEVQGELDAVEEEIAALQESQPEEDEETASRISALEARIAALEEDQSDEDEADDDTATEIETLKAQIAALQADQDAEDESDAKGKTKDDPKDITGTVYQTGSKTTYVTGSLRKIVKGSSWTTVVGSNSKNVIGNSFKTLVGASEYFALSNEFKMQLSLIEKVQLGGTFSYTTSNVSANLYKREYTSSAVKFTGMNREYKGYDIKFVGHELKCKAKGEQLTATKAEVTASEVAAKAKDQQATAWKEGVTAKLDEVTALKTEVEAQTTAIKAQEETIAALKSEVLATQQAVAGSYDAIHTQANQISTLYNVASGVTILL